MSQLEETLTASLGMLGLSLILVVSIVGRHL